MPGRPRLLFQAGSRARWAGFPYELSGRNAGGVVETLDHCFAAPPRCRLLVRWSATPSEEEALHPTPSRFRGTTGSKDDGGNDRTQDELHHTGNVATQSGNAHDHVGSFGGCEHVLPRKEPSEEQ